MSSTKKIINFSQYFNYYTKQKYYIWHPFLESDLENEDANGFALPLVKNVHSLNFGDFLDDEDEESEDDFWSNFINQAENTPWDFKGANLIAYDKVEEQFINYLNSNIWCVQNNYETVIFKKVSDINEAIINTQEALKNDKIKHIINPVFSFKTLSENNDEFIIKAQPFAYDKVTKTIYFKRMNSKTTNKDYLEANYLYQVAKIANIEVEKIKNIIFDDYLQNGIAYKKNKLNFRLIDASSCSKNKMNKQTLRNELGYSINDGTYFSSKNELGIKGNYIYSAKMEDIFAQPTARSKPKTVADFMSKNPSSKFGDFRNIISQIISAYYISKPTFSHNNKILLPDSDLYYGKNKELINKIRVAITPNELQYSPALCKCLGTFDQNYLDQFWQRVKEKRSYHNLFSSFVFEILSLIHQKNKRIIWYDYEGLSSVFPIIDYLNPYIQIAHQVSIIETVNGKIVSKENIVKDPKNITIYDLLDNIISVYSNKADYYIVFNKGYENTRNKELLELIKLYHKDNKHSEQIKHYLTTKQLNLEKIEKLINHINNNTIDLLDFFKPISKSKFDERYRGSEAKNYYVFKTNYVPQADFHKNNLNNEIRYTSISKNDSNFNVENLAMDYYDDRFSIFIYELWGKTSIKKIEHIITENKFNLRHIIKPYKSLEIQNGSMALEESISRKLGIIGDSAWETKIDSLKEYCENDVMAMIMTYDFIMEIVASVFKNIYDTEYKLDENQYYDFDAELLKLVVKSK
ncbi:DUF2779 domain-containing protein [Mycoplasmopsis caviae]|uniref:DUF2779 domain-containing protein n=1 Tax=Mycoplasmopsis caviae TaxID=55603 RepID=A0A3P8KAK4_9BACT|nr:DUF2779 domain-containing protein [Mycoplasmopsis caviae]UUD35759.1 DUF2779 domain-containing protein [Mycoplasmopsis caviae]VDR42409.1 Domain of uncharacterised function(DUF2779) [Mycoplasmopsis caviae]